MKIKSNIKLFFCGLLSFILLLSGMNLNIYAQENTLSSNTTDITSVKDATVLYTNCPLISSHSNAWVSASASGGRAHAKGYITYYEPYRETLTGSGSWGFK